jgi:hypothetical protein
MKAETFLRKLAVPDLNARVVVNNGYPYYSKRYVKDVRILKDGTISLTLGYNVPEKSGG